MNNKTANNGIYILIGLGIVAAAILIYCLRYRANLFMYYQPASFWNDELIYYKQIEGIVKYNFPLGYFGYNEGHAVIGNMAAWSPIMYIPDILLGKLFGISYAGIIIFHILYIMLAFILLSVFGELQIKNLIGIGVGFALYTSFSRYVISVMSEALLMSLCIIYILLFIRIQKSECRKKELLLSVIIISILILMRPYLILLWIPIFMLLLERKFYKSTVYGSVAMGVIFIFYFFITQNFSSPYLFPLIKTEWLLYIVDNPMAGLGNAASLIIQSLAYQKALMVCAITKGDFPGAVYTVFYLLTSYLIYKSILGETKRQYVSWLIINFLMVLAVSLCYDTMVGSRHLLLFSLIELIFIFSVNEYSFKSIDLHILLVGIAFVFLIRLNNEYDVALPCKDNILIKEMEYSQAELSRIPISIDNPWDNTMVWVLPEDSVNNFRPLYSLPSGMGINICTGEYIFENFNSLKSKYISVEKHSSEYEMLMNSEKNILYQNEYFDIAVFQLY